MQQNVQQELQQALEAQDEAKVGQILISLFINTEKGTSSVTPESLHQEVAQVFSNLQSSQRDYWTNIASRYSGTSGS